MSDKNSYTSANSMPFKVLKDRELLRDLSQDYITPIHLQICPTNRCNLNCTFCSCSARERKEELDINELKEIIDISSELGVKAFTVTGGGEPLLHPNINDFIYLAKQQNIELGLVSNGLLLTNLTQEVIQKITWIRVSFDDSREIEGDFERNMDYLVIQSEGKVDLAFSYVVSKDYNIDNIVSIIEYANKNKFTHVRLVPDLYNTELINLEGIKEALQLWGIDLSICIFQDRSEYTKGMKECGISLLKPLIAPDGYVYPCCGVQYALKDTGKQRAFSEEMRMGHYEDLPKIIEKQQMFNGEICYKCYYENYNVLLKGLKTIYAHQNFL